LYRHRLRCFARSDDPSLEKNALTIGTTTRTTVADAATTSSIRQNLPTRVANTIMMT
jgi:hypothetical protein